MQPPPYLIQPLSGKTPCIVHLFKAPTSLLQPLIVSLRVNVLDRFQKKSYIFCRYYTLASSQRAQWSECFQMAVVRTSPFSVRRNWLLFDFFTFEERRGNLVEAMRESFASRSMNNNAALGAMQLWKFSRSPKFAVDQLIMKFKQPCLWMIMCIGDYPRNWTPWKFPAVAYDIGSEHSNVGS